MLPNIVPQLIRIRQLLDEFLNRVLPQTEEVRTRDRIAMLTVSNVISSADDDGPGSGSGPRSDGPTGLVLCDDLEFWAIAAVKNSAMIDRFGCGIDGGEVAPDGNNSASGQHVFIDDRKRMIDRDGNEKVRAKHTPRYFISNWENIPFRMKVFPHTNFTETYDGHDSDIQGEKGLSFLVSRNGRNVKGFRSHCMGL